MTSDALARVLRSLCGRKRFRPFLIDFHSGDRVLVRHPEAVRFLDEDQLIIHVDPHVRNRVFESSSVCQVLDVPTE